MNVVMGIEDKYYQEQMRSLRNGLPTELRKIELLERARTILGNMAQERKGFWNSLFGRRWPINHEPLRSDARNLLALIDAEIGN